MHRLVRTAGLFIALAAAQGFAQGQTVNLNNKVAGDERQTILYAPGVLSLRGMDVPASIRILDIRGRLVSAGIATECRFGFTGFSGGAYQVLAEAEGKTFRLRFVAPQKKWRLGGGALGCPAPHIGFGRKEKSLPRGPARLGAPGPVA